MIVKTAVNKYINTSKEIFLQSGLDFVSVNKEENVISLRKEHRYCLS